MRHRSAAIGLALFMVVALTLTWLVYVTLRRDVAGRTEPYAAMFTDVFGLRVGDDVRMAGVRVGRVENVELQGNLREGVVRRAERPSRSWATPSPLSPTRTSSGSDTSAVAAAPSATCSRCAPAASSRPSAPTRPSTWEHCCNGYEPLFSVLDVQDADNLTKGVIQSLQGDPASITALVDQTSRLTESFAGQDQALGDTITDLNKLFGTLARPRTTISTTSSARPGMSYGRWTRAARN